ncbi:MULTISPECIES: bifunctional serine/threonine-protein kinase/ABC transporter substrate-binding protein [unclassified Microcoleus]|uniref:bifunctional serine/threonine-protein kinase/ABC transporter substrate-binding protein n=1 Tax=unclassified Microcoleus TaxID=2642155 RepID=UPI002FD78B31
MTLNPGDVIGGQYKILDELGHGGFSKTYLAEDKNNPSLQVVVKEIISSSSALAILQEAKHRFNTETQVLKRLGTHSQIPELFNSCSKQGKFYIIQEFIEGNTLSQELTIGKRLKEDEVIRLLQDILGILKFVHQEQVIHRDIKPSNIMHRRRDGKLVLIDFGAVKEISTLGESAGLVNPTVSIGTIGYMPPEQANRQPKFSSDIYAVGMVGIQALTGLNPSSQIQKALDGEIIWHPWAQVSPELANILDKMVRYHFNDRYQSASEALQALRALTPLNPPPPRRQFVFSPLTQLMSQVRSLSSKKILWLGLAVATLVAALVFNFSRLPTPQPPIKSPQKIAPGENHLSEGKTILIPGSILSEKQNGVKAFTDGKYSEAIRLFEQARKKEPRDPETLIYLNNARIAAQKLAAYTIAVVAPLNSSTNDVNQWGEELLRGVAQVQDEVNQGQKINGKSLKVVLADDADKEDQGTEIANVLTAKSDILAVVGHFSSSVTLKTAPVYETKKLVLVSPTSTSEDISKSGDFIFRTVSSDRVTAQSLSGYLLNKARQQRVAVFYNPGDPYSQSLRAQFQTNFTSGGGNIVEEFDLSNLLFNPDKTVDKAKKLGSTGLVLFPNTSTHNQAIKVIKANRDGYCMVGGDTLYNYQTLKEAGEEAVNRLVIATFWHILNSPNQQFPKDSEMLWRALVSPNTASAYDATRAVIEALKTLSQPTRISVQKALADPNFKTIGATGYISFDNNGDRKESTIQLVAVVPSSNNSAYEFVPIDDPRVRFNCP